MPEKKEDTFKVSDRRPFTADGQLRQDAVEEVTPAAAAPTVDKAAATAVEIQDAATVPASDIPPPPTATEQHAQHDAYKQSSRDLDARVELGGHSAKELEVTFERFMASL